MKTLLTFKIYALFFALLGSLSVQARSPKIDPIKFTLTTTATNITLGEEFEVKITASYQSINPNLVYVFHDANVFKLKMVFPDGFQQTGGSYLDYVGTELSSSKQTVSYNIKGKLTRDSGDGSFLLLRGNKNAHAESDFILVGQVGFSAFNQGVTAKEESTARIAVVSQEYIPFMTIAEFRAGEVDTTSVIYIKQGKKSGVFIRDDADASTTDDNGALTLVYGTKRYKRRHDNIFFTRMVGAAGDRVTDDRLALQNASNAAGLAKAELQLNYKYLVVTTDVSLKSNISGFGTVLTRTGATLVVADHNLTVKDITVDGNLSGANSETGCMSTG